MVEPREISCGTFRAVFGTQFSEQGAVNLAHHLGICPDCTTFAQSKRADARVPVVSCERYWEIDALGDQRSLRDEDVYWKHYKQCASCKTESLRRAQELVAYIFKEKFSG